ncbi:uncharacterized protein PHALS_09075 [Plasmopara halstedii]|uniref:Uncharacterized protein n=1 Tax=Plasmopara halstedii TaxID=4781 RepID=A0A0P1AEM4_PLAHL|nr:uncharacterized protein PHALS_09075 [Plasmopara halstedii]CEG39010.1 hypothetical protein PHALS_09075 [Plasmopara halstedii]|eukprot:XP_024575379.1 hypothetical protein PHALS_09075 [Plasmopara halstedii]
MDKRFERTQYAWFGGCGLFAHHFLVQHAIAPSEEHRSHPSQSEIEISYVPALIELNA